MFMNTFDGWNDELYHHGIKGQKWGIRQYQNKDGTLTPEGIIRYRHTFGEALRGIQDRLATKKIYMNDINPMNQNTL